MAERPKLERRPPALTSNHRPYLVAGYLLIAAVFVGVGGWSAFARLDSAVVAAGKVAAKSNRKTIQHLEGGIVSSILVREGQVVAEGDLLMRLHPTIAEASLDMHENQLDALLVQEARLVAESTKQPSIDFPDTLRRKASQPQMAKLMQDQNRLFNERRSTLEGQTSILRSKIAQLERAVVGLSAAEEAARSQLESWQSERTKIDPLLKKGLFPLNKLSQMEREILELTGRVGQTTADVSRTQQTISETELQILHNHLKFQEDVAKELREVRVQLSDVREKVRMATDVYGRLELRAPSAGMVQNLKQHTVGGVVRPGEPILEIAPVDDSLHVHARVATLDVHYVRSGLEAEVRFPGFKGRNLPVMLGQVHTVSKDILFDEQTREPYYLAIIEVSDAAIPEELRHTLTAGVPTEVIIATGERTVVEYLVSPLFNATRTAMREH